MNQTVIVEWEVQYAEAMTRWCRHNRIPVVHHWIEAVLNADGDHVSDEYHYLGTRGLYSERYRERTGSSPYTPDEILCYVFLVRDRDFDLWKLKFQTAGDRMYLDSSVITPYKDRV